MPERDGGGMVILGVDPGLNATGYGLVLADGPRCRVIAAGDIRPPRRAPLPERLGRIREELSRLIVRYRPQTGVLEMIFSHQSYPSTAALMGHARGAACLALQEHGVAMAEYPPARIKQALTGVGSASKAQVARMLEQWTGACDPAWSSDATDALALAVAHAHMQRRRNRLPAGAAR